MLLDHTFIFWAYVGVVSCVSVVARAVDRPVHIPVPAILAYNLVNCLLNIYIVAGLAPHLCSGGSGVWLGFGVPDNKSIRHFVYLHYLTKYMDFVDTCLILLRHKWKQLHFLHLYHHSTIGVLWKWVYEEAPALLGATYGFGAAANSFIHALMYMHYFMTVAGVRNPLKRCMTSMQMLQFVVCIVHAGQVMRVHRGLPFVVLFPAAQVWYMCTMLALFGYFVCMKRDRPKKLATEPSLASSRLTVRLNGTDYDATEFKHVHPGGNIIEKYDVSIVPDATDAFQNFHAGSDRAERMVRALPLAATAACSEDGADVSQAAELHSPSEFQEMLGTWRLRGYYSGGRLEFGVWATSVAAGVLWVVRLLSRGHPACAGVAAGVVWGQCGFVQHHAGHLAFSGDPRVDFLVQTLYESLAKGGSARWWRNRHNKHHAMPNSVQHDGDLRTTPFFAWDDTMIQKVPTALLRSQHLMFLPVLALYVPMLAVSVVGFVIRRRYWDELGLILLHFLVVSRACADLWSFVTFYCLGYSIQGIYLGCMFGLSHFTMPRVEPSDMHDWATWQFKTTCNWGVGSRFARYFSGYLNLQIEHHIATRMPPENYSLIVDDTRRYAERSGLPYTELSFGEAVCSMVSGLRDTGRREYARRLSLKDA
tara:strand:+ start:303 stop:2243 length:1941 start_codon:yes stop_codon:yes gene_type:complete